MIIPIAGNPYLANAQASIYKKLYSQYIDQLYVYINGNITPDVMQYNIDLFTEMGATVLSKPKAVGHGQALTAMVNICEQDYIMFSEEDFFVFEPSYIERWFNKVESNVVGAVVSRRQAISEKMVPIVNNRFHLHDLLHERQPCFEPCLCILPKKILLKTDVDFRWQKFPKGIFIKELDHTCSQVEDMDIFAWFSIQLRSVGCTFHYEPQHRCSHPLTESSPMTPWIHFGNTHGIMESHLMQGPPPKPLFSYESASIIEWQIALWDSFAELFPIKNNHECVYFNNVYREKIQEYVRGRKLNEANINKNKLIIARRFQPCL